jgi:hypothetical protein
MVVNRSLGGVPVLHALEEVGVVDVVLDGVCDRVVLAHHLLGRPLAQSLPVGLLLHQVTQLVVVLLLPVQSVLPLAEVPLGEVVLVGLAAGQFLLPLLLLLPFLLAAVLLLLVEGLEGVLLLLALVLLVEIIAMVEDVLVLALGDELVDLRALKAVLVHKQLLALLLSIHPPLQHQVVSRVVALQLAQHPVHPLLVALPVHRGRLLPQLLTVCPLSQPLAQVLPQQRVHLVHVGPGGVGALGLDRHREARVAA